MVRTQAAERFGNPFFSRLRLDLGNEFSETCCFRYVSLVLWLHAIIPRFFGRGEYRLAHIKGYAAKLLGVFLGGLIGFLGSGCSFGKNMFLKFYGFLGKRMLIYH